MRAVLAGIGKIVCMDKCYMCDEKASTKEHVPPRSFFPIGHRQDLITVPSCDTHNHENSDDVEYVRAVVVQQLETKGIARTHFQDKVLRSYQRNPKLLARMFSRITPITVDGQETVIFEIEIDTFQLILKSVAYALYRHDFKVNFIGDWYIFSPQSLATSKFIRGMPDGYEEVRSALNALPFTVKSTGNPEVFKYSFCHDSQRNSYFYRFEFYEGFIVYAFSVGKAN